MAVATLHFFKLCMSTTQWSMWLGMPNSLMLDG